MQETDGYTLEQRRALALAAARKRKAEADGADRNPANDSDFARLITGEKRDPLEGQPDFLRKQSFADRLSNAYTLNFGDEIAAAGVAGVAGGIMGAYDAVKERDLGAIPRAVGREYGKIRETQAAQQRNFEQENPLQAGAADIVGNTAGLIQGGAAAGKTLVGKAVERLPTSAKLAVQGATASGLLAAGDAEDGDKLKAGVDAAKFGAIATPVMNKALGAVSSVFKRSNIANAPTIQKIKDRAQALYAKAENSGVRINGKTTQKIADRMRDRMVKEGIKLPSGEFIDDSMTAIKGLDRTLKAFEGKEITPKQALAVRKAFQNAAGSTNPNEARIGRMLLQRYDGFLSRVSPEIKSANALWHRAKKAELVNTARTLGAETRTGQFTQSGLDNALRTEFRQILRGINEGRLKGYSEAEKEAIKRVANGTVTRNVAREVGKLAPNSMVGQLAGSGGIIGASVAGSPTAGAVVAGMMGAGYGGKALANRLAVKQAETAELLIRAGVDKAFVERLTESQREQVALLLAANLSRFSRPDDQDRRPKTENTPQQ